MTHTHEAFHAIRKVVVEQSAEMVPADQEELLLYVVKWCEARLRKIRGEKATKFEAQSGTLFEILTKQFLDNASTFLSWFECEAGQEVVSHLRAFLTSLNVAVQCAHGDVTTRMLCSAMSKMTASIARLDDANKAPIKNYRKGLIMTHLQMVRACWFTRSQIARAFSITYQEAEAFCDRTSTGYATGGYGINIVEKEAGPQDSEARELAAQKLAHVLPDIDFKCTICGD